jgi:hypothetical protein
VLVQLLEAVLAVAFAPGPSRLGGVPIERRCFLRVQCVSAPAVILAALLGIAGIDSVFIQMTFLRSADVAGGPA